MQVQIPRAFKELFQPARYKVYYGGRGGGKSWSYARALLILAAQKPLRVLCTREVQKSIKDSVHTLLRDQIAALGLSDQYEVLNTEIRGRNGSLFIFSGLSDHTVDSIKSYEGVDVCWVEEAHAVTQRSWQILIPTIRKPGSEIWVAFNPRHKHDDTYQRFIVNTPPDAVVKKVSWRDLPKMSAEMRAEMEHLKATDYEEYLHVWEGEIKQIADGAIYGKQLLEARKDGRICKVPIEKSVLVHTFWDLGRNDHTAIWFMQQVGPQHRFIDYYENRLEDLEHYVRVMKDKPYLYGEHYLPHDVEAQILGMNRTRRQQLEDAGIKPIVKVPRIADITEGIGITRAAFASCWFDEERCARGLEALANYAFKYDDAHATHTTAFTNKWATNGSDAFRQFAQGFRPATKNSDWDKPLTVQCGSMV